MALALLDGVGETIVDTVVTNIDMTAMFTILKNGVSGVFSIASSAFGFLMENPLCAIMVSVGFAYAALNIVRKGLRVAKRT